MLHGLRVRAFILGTVVLCSACVGPDAPDVEVCRDVIGRFCLPPYCAGPQSRLNLPDMDCEATLRARTGCDKEDFTFSTPDRERVLACRVPLVRQSTNRSAKPDCDYADEALRNCPDLVTFLGGAQ